jgi:DNA modification methylase
MKSAKKTSSKSKRPDRSPKTTPSTKSTVPARAKTKQSSTEDLSGLKPKETRVEIKPAKGRPMLTWVGKKPLRHAIAYPAQLVETFNAQSKIVNRKSEIETGLLFHGDNKDVLAYLLANGYRGKVKLIYIDPPFDSGADYVRKVNLRNAKKSASIESESYTLGEQIQYADIWANDNYLQFMYERLLLLKELLADDGCLYLHCDSRKNYYLRSVLEEVFTSERFRSEIIWKRTSAHSDASYYGQVHDTILFVTKGGEPIWNNPIVDYEDWYVERYYRYKDKDGKRFKSGDLSAYGLSGGGYEYTWKGVQGLWRCPEKTMKELDEKGKIYYTENGIPRLKQYLDDMDGMPVQTLWDDIQPVVSWSTEGEAYPTQKPEALVERIIEASSNSDDIVLDCFLGSGTTAAVAQKTGRRWIGADINKGAIQTTIKRLQGVMNEQVDLTPQPPLLKEKGSDEPPKPAQLGFAVYRVNDYDLQIQHNEAFNLAVEHLGMTRTKTDAFFDGTLGKKLVKIVPFNHPITPLDLEEVKNELKNRPDEERDIVLVGLGKEYAIEAWLEEWNKLRKQGDIPNKIEVIELRSDPKYGGFFTHEPAKAKVSFKREKDKVEITIDDFISPTILERLSQQNKGNPLFSPQVSDWRSMVDSVMIDSNYDGEVFNITLADVPERKNDLVEGKYTVEVKKGATIAVKVTDMLGEEVLVVS